jgi:ABC-type lipoprotein release transport system permease subunit
MALGASRNGGMEFVLGQASGLAAIGPEIGLGCAVVVAAHCRPAPCRPHHAERLVRRERVRHFRSAYRLRNRFVTALLASYLPAPRAAFIDPICALRENQPILAASTAGDEGL